MPELKQQLESLIQKAWFEHLNNPEPLARGTCGVLYSNLKMTQKLLGLQL